MNHFIELDLHDNRGTVQVRPEHVSSIETCEEDSCVIIRMLSGVGYCVEPGQFVVSKLVNRTSHAGMRVI